MINVTSGNGHASGSFVLVDLRLIADGMVCPVVVEVLCDELIRALVSGNARSLPCYKSGHKLTLELGIFSGKAFIDRATDIREIFPCGDAVAPVVQPELAIEFIDIRVFFL